MTISNGVVAANGTTKTGSGKDISAYSVVQIDRLDHRPPLPAVLLNPFKLEHGPPSSAAGNPEEIAKLFPNLFGQPSAQLVTSASPTLQAEAKLKIGVVLSGGQAPGGHNVIAGIFDYLQNHAKGSTLLGFKGGPAGIMKCKYVEISSEFLYPYRNQGGFDIICSGRDKIETPEQGQKNLVADALSQKPLVQAISAIHHSSFEDMVDQYATDIDFVDIFTWIRDGETVAGYSIREGYLMRKTMLRVTQPLREKVMIECHCPPFTGHRGIATTMKGVERYFYWPRLKKDVKEFVPVAQYAKRSSLTGIKHRDCYNLYPFPPPMGKYCNGFHVLIS
ncbi:hypothetical protein L7F22_056931 [Adiantum nelumboides]|nr:hypothetical protein [Adiantum nelumboides]